MEVKSHVEILRLHCEHISVLLARLITDLTTIERSIATDEHPSFASVAACGKGWEAQGEKIATESVRLQSFLHALTEALEGAGASQENTSSTVETPMKFPARQPIPHLTESPPDTTGQKQEKMHRRLS